MEIKSTNEVSGDGVKAVVYGASGVGKTRLGATMPKPLILSAESGLLSIAGTGIDYVEISDLNTLGEAYSYLSGEGSSKYQSVVLDSLSEIAEVCLAHAKRTNKDPRAAYGEMQNNMADIIRSFRDLKGMNVLMIAKMDKMQDESGRILYGPSMPGKKAGQALPYFFDIVAALRAEKDNEGVVHRALMLHTDGVWDAKDRSGKLDSWEPADFSAIINKIKG